MRAMVSAMPPAAVGTRIFTGLLGHSPALRLRGAGDEAGQHRARQCSSEHSNSSLFRLSFAARATFAHFSSSDLICALNSAGVLPTASAPSAAMRFCISGDFSAAAISLCSLATIGAGVPAGANSPYHWIAS